MKSNKSHVAIFFSYRFECLNVLLDILKNNFKSEVITHVFCNLSKESFNKYKEHIDSSLIDNFYHIDDPNCNENHSPAYGHKFECKRRQPVDAFIKILSAMSSIENVDKFIYTECDIFPIDELKYFKQLDNLSIGDFRSRFIPEYNSKLPYGYCSPSPIYFSKKAAYATCEIFKKLKNQYHNRGMSFEGMLGHVTHESKQHSDFSFYSFSDYHTGNNVPDHNLEPISLTTHQHNVLNLEGILKENKLEKGMWIKNIISKDEWVMAWEGKLLFDKPYNMSNIMEKTPGFTIKEMALYSDKNE
jgi:hypothetical protein